MLKTYIYHGKEWQFDPADPLLPPEAVEKVKKSPAPKAAAKPTNKAKAPANKSRKAKTK